MSATETTTWVERRANAKDLQRGWELPAGPGEWLPITGIKVCYDHVHVTVRLDQEDGGVEFIDLPLMLRTQPVDHRRHEGYLTNEVGTSGPSARHCAALGR